MFRIRLMICVLVFFLPAVVPDKAMCSSGGNHEITVPIPQPDIRIEPDSGGSGRFIGKDILFLGRTGEPSLPYQGVTVLLPPDADLSTVDASLINPRWERMTRQWDIPPVPPMATWDGARELVIWPEGRTFVDGRDVEVYGTETIYPAKKIRHVNAYKLRTFKLARVVIAAYSYNPMGKSLFRLVEGGVQVTFDRDPAIPAETGPDNIGRKYIRNHAVNYDAVIGEYQTTRRSTGGRSSSSCYAIITTAAIQNGSTELVNFVASKEYRGFTVEVVIESSWGGGTGDTAAENIRSWLQDNYLVKNIEYVLLIGDPDPSDGDVPMKMLWPRYNSTFYPEYRDAPSDLYYAELTEEWDWDGDGYYGEYDDDFDEEQPVGYEVSVGRIPYYDDMASLDHILSKTVTFENDHQISQWCENVLLPMEPSDEDTDGYHLGEEIKDNILIPKSWGYHRVYDDINGYSGDPIPIPGDTESVPCTVTNVTDAWNGEHFGAVFWWTHGNTTSASDVMDLSHAATLDDNHPGFTFQCSCYNGHPESSDSLGYSLLKNGCVNTISASRVSWYWIGQTSFQGSASNAGMTYEYARRLISYEMFAGKAFNDLREDVVVDYDTQWMNYLVFNIYGCPATGLYNNLIYVPDDYPTIQHAINAADEGVTIVVKPGTYYENIDFYGKAVVVRSAFGPEDAVINGMQSGRVVTFDNHEGPDSVLDGFTITNGSDPGGGGIRCSDSSPQIINNIISGNSAQYGGGIRCFDYSCHAVVDNNLIEGNYASKEGGGIYCVNAPPTITNNIISDNESGHLGGGICCDCYSDMTFNNNTVMENSAVYGGGAYIAGYSDPVAVNNLFIKNEAVSGAGLCCDGYGSLELTNCTISGNSADDIGGGIYISHVYKAKITNTIFWDNHATIDNEIFLESTSSSITYCDVKGGYPGEGNILQDPLFVDPGNNDFHLTWLSPCINRGKDEGAPPEDMDGDHRPNMGTVDMGADEYHGTHVLNVDTLVISQYMGGTINFNLNGGSVNANRQYLILGGISGTAPGTPLPGGLVFLPINWDVFTCAVLSLANSPMFVDFMGILDGNGSSFAQANFGPMPGAGGITMYFAFALNAPWDFVSNPVAIDVL